VKNKKTLGMGGGGEGSRTLCGHARTARLCVRALSLPSDRAPSGFINYRVFSWLLFRQINTGQYIKTGHDRFLSNT
jgi:hypothetical protein